MHNPRPAPAANDRVGRSSGAFRTLVSRRPLRSRSRTMDPEARRQTRLEKTYSRTSEHLFLLEAVVTRTEPIISFEGEPGPPDFPNEAEMRRLNAEVAVFGSKEVRDKLRCLASRPLSGSTCFAQSERAED